MTSYTPREHADVTVWAAMKDGIISGGLMAVPATLAVYTAMNFSPKFAKATNWQSRTALVIMPTLFAFGYSAESKLVHRMHEMASEAEHSKHMAEWTQQHMLDEHQKQLKRMSTQRILSQPGMGGHTLTTADEKKEAEEQEKKISAKFRESVLDSGVRVVPGESLGVHHQLANFWQENPFKILAFLGVPTVLYIFKGKSGQEHLSFQLKVMHTRVFGQFAVITMLLTLMGFKEYMDRSGKFITEADVQARVARMQQNRTELLMRLQRDRERAEALAEKRRVAHEADLKSSQVKNLVNDA